MFDDTEELADLNRQGIYTIGQCLDEIWGATDTRTRIHTTSRIRKCVRIKWDCS